MKITLVQPPALMGVDNYSTITQPPLGIAYLAAHARDMGHEVQVVDAVGDAIERIVAWPNRPGRLQQGLSTEEILKRVPCDTEVIGVSCMFTHAWPLVREVMLALKNRFPQARLIAGGEHATALPHIVLQQSGADVCVLGEGEDTLRELLGAFERGADWRDIRGIAHLDSNGELIKTAERRRIQDPDTLPWPAWDLLDPAAYMARPMFMGPSPGRTMPMLATRGCPFRCTFCSSPNMWTQYWKARDPATVVDEMECYMQRYGADDFQFQDLTAIVRKDWIIAFCKEIVRRNLRLTWSLPVGTRSEAIDAEVASHLKASGCHHITYAPESGSKRILKLIEKKVNLDHLEESARCSLRAGLKVCLFHLIGIPQENMDDIRETFRWIRRMAKVGVHEITLSTFVPLPGTQLFDETSALSPIRIDDDYFYWMTGYTGLLSVRSWNRHLSSRKLLLLKLWGLVQFYALSSLYHPDRVWSTIRNLIRGKQETKVDRVLQEYAMKLRAMVSVEKSSPRGYN